MTAIPVWLLDVDGVINALSTSLQRKHDAWPKEKWVQFEAQGTLQMFQINAATPVADFLREIHEAGLAEIRWHTTWQHSALIIGEKLGLPEFPVHEAPEYEDTAWHRDPRLDSSWWKLPGAWRVVTDEQRPLLWTDDDITYDMTIAQRKALRAVRPHEVLLVAPDGYTGLAQPNLRRIHNFLQEVRDGAPVQ